MNGIGAVVKVVDSNLCGWGSIPGKNCSFFIVFLSKGLSLCFTCSDQHVKYRMPHGFPLTSSLLLDYHVKQYIHTHIHTYVCVRACVRAQLCLSWISCKYFVRSFMKRGFFFLNIYYGVLRIWYPKAFFSCLVKRATNTARQ